MDHHRRTPRRTRRAHQNAITEATLHLGHVTGDASYEEAEDEAFGCVIAIAEMDIDFDVTDDFRRRLKEAIHDEQLVLTSIHDAEGEQ